MYPHSRTFQAFKKNKQGEKRILISGNHLYIQVQITQFLLVTVIEPRTLHILVKLPTIEVFTEPF